jgi:urease accessory protein
MKTMKSYLKLLPLFIIILLTCPDTAHAHLIGGNGLMMSGITHPLLGLDHLLAMVAVGIISVRIGGRAMWQVPLTFVSFLIIGGILALLGLNIPLIETGIALSVLICGIAIASAYKIDIQLALICTAFFALFHGYAHGTEIPLIASPALYAIGFTVSTALLHISGIVAGYYASKTELTSKLLKYSGVGIAFTGLYFLLNI